jgi:ABC-type phosphate transport system substrate-binding protein
MYSQLKIQINMKSKLIIALLAFFSLTAFAPAPTEIAVIVSKENTIDKLSSGEVKLYWLRKIKKRWPDLNKNIKPADRKSKCGEQDAFYSKVLGMSASDVETYFTQKQYESAEKPQDKFTSDADIITFVSEEAGAIGFVNAASLTAEAKAKVKVVLIVQ